MRQELERAFGEAVADAELAPGTHPEAAATVMVRLGLGAIVDWVVQMGDPEDLRTDLLRSVSVVIAAFS